jgi:putative salt-induced outer membrane protein YdiY
MSKQFVTLVGTLMIATGAAAQDAAAPKPWTSSIGAGLAVTSSEVLGRSSSGALKAGEDFDWALSPTSKFTQKFTALWKMSDFGDALYHVDVGLATSVMTRIELKIAYAYDHKTRPPSPTVEKGDSALFAALLYKF